MAVITGTQNSDNLNGTPENDVIDGLARDDILSGNAGNDELNGGEGSDRLDGNLGEDSLKGDDPFPGAYSNVDNLLRLNREGQDTLYGGFDNDRLEGGAGQDYLSGGEGDDVLWGGYNAGEGVAVSPEQGYFFTEYRNNNYGDDVLEGGLGNDTLRGDSIWVDSLSGSSAVGGDDKLDGGPGNDLLEGGIGSDELYGGAGNDRLYGGYEVVQSSRQIDGSRNFLYGEAGDDYLVGSNSDDFLDGGVGNDVLDGYDERFTGEDTLYGGFGDDTLFGRNGSDLLNGGPGNDVLIGDVEFNPFQEENWVDTLTGGIGQDRFVLGTEIGSLYGPSYSGANESFTDYAIVTDFNFQQDIIQLADSNYGGALQYTIGSAPEGLPQGTAIYLDGETDRLIAVVEGVSDLSLDQSYFIFV